MGNRLTGAAAENLRDPAPGAREPALAGAGGGVTPMGGAPPLRILPVLFAALRAWLRRLFKSSGP